MGKKNKEPRVLILCLRWVPFIDISGLQALEDAIIDLQQRHVRVIITGANARVSAKLQKAGVLALLGENNVFANFSDALGTLV